MIQYECDGCGVAMRPGALRYQVTIDVRAAYDQIVIGLADLVRDHRAEMIRLIKQMEQTDPAEIEAQVYKHFKRDLCPRCYAIYAQDPLRFQPRADAPGPPFDVDAFLRSLGYPPEK